MKNVFCIAALCAAIITNAQGSADHNSGNGKTVAVANSEYDRASKFKRVFFGDHYRKEWATPVEVEQLFLDTSHGGLKPVKMGGGKQTMSLRLLDKNGKEWVLRSVDKDPSRAIPIEFVGTFADDIVQDQISSSNPYAPMVVASLASAAGIYHTTPRIYYVPFQEALGEYNRVFANKLALLEERPVGDQTKNPDLDYADKVVNSEKLFEKVLTNSDHQMDEHAFLKARLFDMWIGDWDRHEDQWLWASFKVNGKTLYKPIPRDRDQAFAKLDGFLPQVASKKWALRKTKNFDYHVSDVNGLNTNGAFVDRSFTTRLTWNDWQKIIDELQANLTDNKIEEAFLEMPPNIYEISAKQVISKLKKRRDDLEKYAHTYYQFLSREVSITGTDDKEIFEVVRMKDSIKVSVYSFKKRKELIYQRTFSTKGTKEIRLYGLEDHDQFIITGKSKKGTLVRVVGGKGDDNIKDNSFVKGAGHKTKVYDDECYVDGAKETRSYISNDSLKNTYNRKSYRYDYLAPQWAPGYNPDDGVYIGGGIIYRKQQFGKSPFGQLHSLKANYANATKAYNFWYEGIFMEAIGKWNLRVDAVVNAPHYTFNYFGLGNETELNTDDKNYNRIRSNQVNLTPSVFRQFAKAHTLEFGLGYSSTRIKQTTGRFVTDHSSGLESADLAKKYFGTAGARYEFNTLDNVLYPKKGFRLISGIEFTQNLEETDRSFSRLSGNASWFTSFNSLTAAFRVGAATNFGSDYEFYQANAIGGGTHLRGFRRSRFAGETSAYQNAELRLKLKTAKGYFFRGNFGVMGFFDSGRVWVDGEDSNKWHYSYGGGAWFLPYNKIAFTASYGISKEDKLLNIKAGFMF